MRAKIITLLLSCLFFVACGSDRDSNSPVEWPAGIWTFQNDGAAPVQYNFSGGMTGSFNGNSVFGLFSYQQSGGNSGILNLNYLGGAITELYVLEFKGDQNGSYTLTRTDNSVTPARQTTSNGTFRR